MGIEIIRIDEQNKKIKITSLPEDSYLKIDVKGWKGDGSSFATIFYTIYYTNGKKYTDEFFFGAKIPLQKHHEPITSTNNEIESVELELTENSITDFHVELKVQKGRDLIDIKNPITNFRNFINARVNSRILFSGAFGQGKTTFLNFFFDEAHKNDYTVFRVFPVNYSVSSNEDVFRYIKSDILFQLLGRDIDFDKQEINLLESFQEYAYLNPRKTIISFLKNVSRLNSKTEILSKSIDVLNDFMTPILEYHQEQQVDDKQLAKSYIQEIYEKEGSLFEDNFYTQLIRQLLEQIKKKTEKPTVLIIEDLDRMDPDHIFRILNVISAHYDTYAYNENVEIHNKFSFDKIILVCDIDNIRNIFHHKYGEKTDFEGYINKYYSSHPFFFSNKQNIITFLGQEIEKANNYNPRNEGYRNLITLLIESKELSLREMLKLLNGDFINFKNYSSDRQDKLIKYGLFNKSFHYLIELYGEGELKRKLKNISTKTFPSTIDFHELTIHLMIALGSFADNRQYIIFEYKGYDYSFTFSQHHEYEVFMWIQLVDNTSPLQNTTPSLSAGGPKKMIFDKNDFIELAIETINIIHLNE